MPGRFTLTATADQLRDAFPGFEVPDQWLPRYNVAPGAPIAVITNEGTGALDFLTWGLVPPWSSGVKMDKLLINARSETAASKPSFKNAFRRRRFLVLADGVYEWIKFKGKKNKVPYYIYLKGHPVFAYAGLWETWHSIDGSEVKSCCILTCEPNELVAKIHHRMGVILHPKDYKAWLQPDEVDPKAVQPLMRTYPADEMAYHQVTEKVSWAKNDEPENIAPVPEDEQQEPGQQETLF